MVDRQIHKQNEAQARRKEREIIRNQIQNEKGRVWERENERERLSVKTDVNSPRCRKRVFIAVYKYQYRFTRKTEKDTKRVIPYSLYFPYFAICKEVMVHIRGYVGARY